MARRSSGIFWGVTDPLAPLAELPGVAAAGDEARDALGKAHRHRTNLRGWPKTCLLYTSDAADE